MKYLLSLWCLVAVSAQAQFVSLYNFNTNHFRTNTIPAGAGKWLVNANTNGLVTFPSISTNSLNTNGYLLSVNTNVGSTTYNAITNLVNLAPQVWTNDPDTSVLGGPKLGIYPVDFSNNPDHILVHDSALDVGVGVSKTLWVENFSTVSDSSSETLTDGGGARAIYGNLRHVTGQSIDGSQGIGVFGVSEANFQRVYGVGGFAVTERNDVEAIGVGGMSVDDGPNSNTTNIGGYFSVSKVWNSVKVPYQSSILLLDNRDSGLPLLMARTNEASPIAVFSLNSGGDPVIPNGAGLGKVLTDADGVGTARWVTSLNSGVVTNFATTNSNAGLTNAIQTIVNGSVNVRTNYIPFSSPNTNTLTASIMFQTNGTKEIAMRNGDAPDGTLALSLKVIGKQTSETVKDWLDLKYSVANGDYEIMSDNGASGTTRSLTFGTGGTRYWNLSTAGHLLPISNNASDIGASSDGIRRLYYETSIVAEQNASMAVPSMYLNQGANSAGFYFSGGDMGFGTLLPSEALRLTMGSGAPGPFIDCGPSAVAFGSACGSPIAFMRANPDREAGVIQLGTNNLVAATPLTYRIHGIAGSGSNIPGGSAYLAGGPATGSGVPGNVGFETGTNGAAISTAGGRVRRHDIEGHEFSLTQSSATLVVNVTVPSKGYLGIRCCFTTHADDGTDFQSVNETFSIAAVNKSGTVTTAISASTPMATVQSSGTLTSTWTAVANGNSVDIKCNAVSSLTETTLKTTGRLEIDSDGPAVVTWQ